MDEGTVNENLKNAILKSFLKKQGKFNLSHIWDRVLLNTKGLTLNKQGNNNNSS